MVPILTQLGCHIVTLTGYGWPIKTVQTLVDSQSPLRILGLKQLIHQHVRIGNKYVLILEFYHFRATSGGEDERKREDAKRKMDDLKGRIEAYCTIHY